MSRFALAVLCCLALVGCRGRVSVSDDQRPFDAATETLRAEAAQIAARAESRLRGTDSARQAPLIATRDSLRAALDALARAPQAPSDSLQATIERLTDRLRRRVARVDSAEALPTPSR